MYYIYIYNLELYNKVLHFIKCVNDLHILEFDSLHKV